MRRPLVMAVRFVAIIAVITAAAGVFVPPSHTGSPYLSALSDLAASSALAAKPMCSRMCEFASPGYVCTEAVHSRCTFPSTGGCVTQSC